MSSFTDTKARQQTVDFVTYFSSGTSFYVKSSGGPAVTSLADLCGHTVVVEKGTTQQLWVDGELVGYRQDGAPIRVKGVPKAQAAGLARELLQQVGLLDKAAAYPRQLSGPRAVTGHPMGGTTASMRCGPGSASASRSAAANSAAVVARRAGTPMPVARATKSRSGRDRPSKFLAASPAAAAPTRLSSMPRIA